MTHYETAASDLPLSTLSVTERVFEGLAPRLEDVVIIDGLDGRRFTAGDVIDHVKRLAGGLRAAGHVPQKPIALMAPNSPEYCIIFHAVAWAGGTITTLNPTYTAHEIRHQLRDSGAGLLITDPATLAVAKEALEELPEVRLCVIGSADDCLSLSELYGSAQEQQCPVDLDRHSVVLPYSSGTTGLPKGVCLSHRNLSMNIDQTAQGAEFRAGETAAAFLPFFHIYGMTVMMNMHLACGGVLVTMPRFDLELFLRICQDHRARRMWIVPPVALALAKHPLVDAYDLSALEQVFSGAAPMGSALSDAVASRLNCAMLQGYGMTELAPVSHITPLSTPRSGASGLALPNTHCRIVSPETGKDLPPGEEGELWIKGPQVMIGYLNNETATQDTLTSDGWLKTGDVAIIDADGYMFIVDRLKELIKYKGFQVAPAELEACLVAHPQIQDAAVIGLPDEEAGEVPVAFVVSADPAPSSEEIQSYVGTQLSHYKQLHRVTFVEAIPKSPSGKILRRLLRNSL
ncbi:MAG: AMP-binding protein [Planktomarina temperata]|nr:AMP-binding protein [Planktomarina temperata]